MLLLLRTTPSAVRVSAPRLHISQAKSTKKHLVLHESWGSCGQSDLNHPVQLTPELPNAQQNNRKYCGTDRYCQYIGPAKRKDLSKSQHSTQYIDSHKHQIARNSIHFTGSILAFLAITRAPLPKLRRRNSH